MPAAPHFRHQDYEGAEKSQLCHKYFLQYSTFTSERRQVRTWGAKLGSCPGRHLTSLRPWPTWSILLRVATGGK